MEARATAARHSGALLNGVDLGMETRAAAAGHSGAVLTGADLGLEAGNFLEEDTGEEWSGVSCSTTASAARY
jgi:hypothetical protein